MNGRERVVGTSARPGRMRCVYVHRNNAQGSGNEWPGSDVRETDDGATGCRATHVRVWRRRSIRRRRLAVRRRRHLCLQDCLRVSRRRCSSVVCAYFMATVRRRAPLARQRPSRARPSPSQSGLHALSRNAHRVGGSAAVRHMTFDCSTGVCVPACRCLKISEISELTCPTDHLLCTSIYGQTPKQSFICAAGQLHVVASQFLVF